MSRYQQFSILCLLITLLSGCTALQQGRGSADRAASEQADACQCLDQQLHLQQGIHNLELELQQAQTRIRSLEAERDSLAAKLDALTAIERSLHERKQRQSNEP